MLWVLKTLCCIFSFRCPVYLDMKTGEAHFRQYKSGLARYNVEQGLGGLDKSLLIRCLGYLSDDQDILQFLICTKTISAILETPTMHFIREVCRTFPLRTDEEGNTNAVHSTAIKALGKIRRIVKLFCMLDVFLFPYLTSSSLFSHTRNQASILTQALLHCCFPSTLSPASSHIFHTVTRKLKTLFVLLFFNFYP